MINAMVEEELSSRVIGAAIAVHASLGPGLAETAYANALAVEFAARGIRYERQKVIRVFHREVDVGEHRLDFLVEASLLVGIKAVPLLEEAFFVTARAQMRAAAIRDGLMLNFAALPLAIKRVGAGRGSGAGL